MKKIISIIFIIALSLTINAPVVLFAAANDLTNKPNENYTLLEPIPCIEGAGQDCSGLLKEVKIDMYISYLFRLLIALAVFAAVFQITFAGFKYMMSEVVTDKGAAIKSINDAILGLLCVLSSYLILYTINPDLVTFNAKIQPLDLKINPSLNSRLNISSQQLDQELADFIARKRDINEAQQTSVDAHKRLAELENELYKTAEGVYGLNMTEEERMEKEIEYNKLIETTKKLDANIELSRVQNSTQTRLQDSLRRLNDIDAAFVARNVQDSDDFDKIDFERAKAAIADTFDKGIDKLTKSGANAEAEKLKQEKAYYSETMSQELNTVLAIKNYQGMVALIGAEAIDARNNAREQAYKMQKAINDDPTFSKLNITDIPLQQKLLTETNKRIAELLKIPATRDDNALRIKYSITQTP